MLGNTLPPTFQTPNGAGSPWPEYYQRNVYGNMIIHTQLSLWGQRA